MNLLDMSPVDIFPMDLSQLDIFTARYVAAGMFLLVS